MKETENHMKTADSKAGKASLFKGQNGEIETFREKFEQEPFLFHHGLCEDPRFELAAIRALARRLPGKISFSGNLPVANGFKQPDGKGKSFEEALDQLENGQSWIILKKIQQDSEYASLLGECLKEVEALVQRRLEPLIESRTMSLILSSPDQVTPYHIDADCNFLFQIRGCKTFYVFNGRDRTVLPETEEESFWAGELNAAKYRKENQNKAWSFAMEPGNGVHVPVIYPHWVKNGDNLSISLSINFRFLGRLRGDIYRMNHLIRKMGLHPRALGESRLADALKVILISPPRSGIQMCRKLWRHLM